MKNEVQPAQSNVSTVNAVVVVQVQFRLSCLQFTIIMMSDDTPVLAKVIKCKGWQKYLFANLNTTPLITISGSANGARAFIGNFLWCRRGKTFCEGPFVLHRSQPEERRAKCWRCHPPGKNLCGHPWFIQCKISIMIFLFR